MSCKPIKKTDQGKWWARAQDRMPARRAEKEYILVASEDGKSSTYYFASLGKDPLGNPATFAVIPKGVGRNTQSLICHVKKNRVRWLKEVQEEVDIEDFNQVWVVFDLDGFPEHKFDNAISSAESAKNGFRVAWSNECFELWYLLHFKNQVTGIGREEIYRQLTDIWGLKKSYTEYKGDEGMSLHTSMATNPDMCKAYKRAKRLHAEMKAARLTPHEANPCTLIYELIEVLYPHLKEMCKPKGVGCARKA